MTVEENMKHLMALFNVLIDQTLDKNKKRS